MGVRFRKSVKICKGVRVNFGKTGASLSVGTKGLRKTIHSSGRVTSTVGIPGTGIYYTSSTGGRKSKLLESRAHSNNNTIKNQQRQIKIDNNERQVKEYNELITHIKTIHTNCTISVDWKYLRDLPAPFNPIEPGPLEAEAINKRNCFKSSLIGKIIPSIDKKSKNKLDEQIIKAKKMDLDNYAAWEESQKLATKILDGDIDSYLYVISKMNPFNDLIDYGSDFKVRTNNSDLLEVEFKIKIEDVIPNQVVSLTSTGRLSYKNMTKTMYYDITQDYVCSCIIRIAREIFSLLPIKNVLIHTMNSILNTATGHVEEIPILSINIDRNNFESTNFENIDPSDAVEAFEHHMDFKKTKGLQPVTKIKYKENIEKLKK